MSNWPEILNSFLLQAKTTDLKTSSYPKEWSDLRLRISFGMGMPARIPWIALITTDMEVSEGFYPVYLFYKELEILILAYGVSETKEFSRTWPAEIMNSTQTVSSYLDQKVPRYGDSFVFKAYKVVTTDEGINLSHCNTNELVTKTDLESDFRTITEYYKKVTSTTPSEISPSNQGIFYMERQLEDFLIHNWENTELGKKYDLIIEEGELVSQQYQTDIGIIDILVKDKNTGSYVVIELKRNQTSDDTVGQIARYMGWISDNLKDNNVKGIIIAASYDKKLQYALKIVNNVEVFLYQVDFKLKEYINE